MLKVINLRGRMSGFSSIPRCIVQVSAVIIALGSAAPTQAAEGQTTAPKTVKLAVFDFELNDQSAGGGIIAPDATDTENLKAAAEQAKRQLLATGRYEIVDTSSVAAELASAKGILDCKGCEVPLATKVGADQVLVGVITRVNRTEHTVFMRLSDAHTGAVVSNGFTGLRMGANYAWPRGVKWLLDNKMLAELTAK